MTIREQFAKYSVEEIEEIKAEIARLEKKLAESDRLLNDFRSERNLEMFRSECKTNEDLFMKLEERKKKWNL